VATAPAKRACSVCGALLADDSAYCPVCALQQALGTQTYSDSNSSSELRFEHYTVLQNAEGKPLELGRGAMGVTYKAFDVHLQCPVALKIINVQLFGNESARLRFVREARAAAITITRWSLSRARPWQHSSDAQAAWKHTWPWK
jgi:hypothetical protein